MSQQYSAFPAKYDVLLHTTGLAHELLSSGSCATSAFQDALAPVYWHVGGFGQWVEGGQNIVGMGTNRGRDGGVQRAGRGRLLAAANLPTSYPPSWPQSTSLGPVRIAPAKEPPWVPLGEKSEIEIRQIIKQV